MTATSSTPTVNSSSVRTALDLAGLPDDSFQEGDLACVRDLWPNSTFRLRRGTPAATPDNVTAIASWSGGVWEVFQSGEVSSPPVFADLAELGAYVESFGSGAMAYVQSVRSYFQKQFEGAATVDGITSIRNAMGDATWYRSTVRSPSWQRQAAWYIHPTTGSDENPGTLASPLATFAEFSRRVQSVRLNTMVTVLADSIEVFEGMFVRRELVGDLSIYGQPTVLASGSTTVYVNPNEAGNLRGTVTCAEIADLTPYIGKMLRSTANQNVTPLLAVVVGVGQTGEWGGLTAVSYTAAIPVNGTTLEVLEIVDASPPNLQAYCGMRVTVAYFRLDSAPQIEGGQSSSIGGTVFACELRVRLDTRCNSFTLSCLFNGPQFEVLGKEGTLSIISGGALNSTITIRSSNRLALQGFVVQGGNGVILDGGTPGDGAYPFSRLNLTSRALGIFDIVGDGVTVKNGAVFGGPGRLYGQGTSGYALSFRDGSKGFIQTATYYANAALGQLRFCDAATAISPLTAGANVPAASALTTWAEWNAAPFTRKVVNYSDLTRFLGT